MDGRTSSYVIYVDLPDDGERMLLVHGYTGCYDLVPRRVAAFLRSHESRGVPRPLYGSWRDDDSTGVPVEVPGEASMAVLWKRGYLTRMSVQEEQDRFVRLAALRHEAEQKAPSFLLLPTYSCNLRCFYCFQDDMRSDPAAADRLRRMTPETVDAIFAGIAKLEESMGIEPSVERPRAVGLFGGEPLLAENHDLVAAIIERAHDRGPAHVWAVSNATELDRCEDLLGGDGITWIQVTLDGPPRKHDLRRIHADGSASFEQIARGIGVALRRGVQVNVRINVDRMNIRELPELADELSSRGWSADENFHAYVAPVRACNAGTDRGATFTPWQLDVALDQLRTEFPDVASIARPDDRLRRTVTRLLRTGGAPSFSAGHCGATTGMFVFDALGDVYTCTERAGNRRYAVARVTADGDLEWNGPQRDLWRERSTATLAPCQKCRYGLYCGGGCAALAENLRGNVAVNECDGFARRFRAMVAEAFVGSTKN